MAVVINEFEIVPESEAPAPPAPRTLSIPDPSAVALEAERALRDALWRALRLHAD